MTRYRLPDDQWELIKDGLPGKAGDAEVTAPQSPLRGGGAA
ncbi:MAG TPA: hypothetical protein VJS43_04320 [Candidatus Acidoferrales bacterium]|nr:hypothetical protein [Candidatus Acidoferrales bacterium]